MKNRMISLLLTGLILLTGCSIGTPANPTPTQIVAPILEFVTETPSPISVAPTLIFTPTATPVPPIAANFCSDPQVTRLIDSLKSSILSSDGSLLGTLVSPNGMEVRYFHNGTAIQYSAYQAQFLFDTTYQANWGAHPASGLEKKGSFHEVVVPELKKIFNLPYTLHCNEIRHGGASYPVEWPYQKDFYSIYYAGTDANGNMDWNTWVIGIENVNGKPYIYAVTQFFWEP